PNSPPAPEAPADALKQTHSRRKRRWLRWLFKLLFAFLLFGALVIAIFTYIFSQSDIPRQLVVGVIQRQLGLRMAADDVRVGWLGRATLDEVALALPLAEEAFFQVPRMEVDITALPLVLLGWS